MVTDDYVKDSGVVGSHDIWCASGKVGMVTTVVITIYSMVVLGVKVVEHGDMGVVTVVLWVRWVW